MIKKYIVEISTIFLLFPVIIFFLGFLKIYIAIPLIGLIIYIYYKNIKKEKIDSKNDNENKTPTKISKKTVIYYAFVSILILIWLVFSGIGNFSYQNDDWDVRNAIMRDLVNYDWPVKYDMSKANEQLQQIAGNGTIGLVYYFSYWLPAALFGKIFGLNAGNIFLFVWSFIALMLIVLLINKKIKKDSIWTVLVLIFFSGLDILLINNKLFSPEILQNIFQENHLEWASAKLQYSSNTTQLYWVFNQSIMTWLIIALIIQIKKPETIIFISCLTFCYSPFATFGVIPIVLSLVIKSLLEECDANKILTIKQIYKRIGKVLISGEFIFAFCILIIFGSFYTSSNNSTSFSNFNWIINEMTFIEFLKPYFRFIIVEVLIYATILFWRYKKDTLFWMVLLELLLIPFYRMTPANDFCMRASIGPLFVLTIFVIEYLVNSKKPIEIAIMTSVLAIGLVTPMHEIGRSINHTFSDDRTVNIKDDLIYSIGNPNSDYGRNLSLTQFYAKDLDEKVFFKYFAK